MSARNLGNIWCIWGMAKTQYGYRGDKNICHLRMRSVSIPWDYWGILPFSDWDVKLLEDVNPRLDPTVMTRDQGHSLLMPHDAQMKGVLWGGEHSLSGYEREGEFMDTKESGLIDRINEITWKCSPECFPFLSKIENSITTISSSNWEGQMSTWIRSMQSTWETWRRVWHLKSWMPHGARKQACESPLQTQILLYRNRVSKDLYFTRMFFSGEVNDGRKVQGSWKYIKITEFNKSWSILNWVYKKVRAL